MVVGDTVDDIPCVFSAGFTPPSASSAPASAPCRWRGSLRPIDADRAIPWAEKRVGITLAPMQAEACASPCGRSSWS